LLKKENDSIILKTRDASTSPKNIVHWVTHARKRGVGMWAWLLHRLTAIVALMGIIFHVLRNQFGYITPGGRLFSIDLLVFALSYHTLNGIRVILIELSGWSAKNEDKLFWLVIILTFLFILGWIFTVGL
jgi:succinate dehydrogenase / fumarate reductase cytochrome b subunit